MTHIIYKVAGHRFAVQADNPLAVTERLLSFEPFRCEETSDPSGCLFVMEVCRQVPASGEEVARFDWDGALCVILRDAEAYSFQFHPYRSSLCYVMRTDRVFRRVRMQMLDEPTDGFVLSNGLMMTFAFASASEQTLMVHASVVCNHGRGYLFLGKSGTGKSTHSRLWLQHIPGSELLNDDNPIVRVVDGVPRVYGSPWSGKTPCYRNADAPIGAFVKLDQAPANRIGPVPALHAFATLLASCSLMKWDERVYDGIADTLSAVVERVPVYHLDCLPDEGAARLSYETIRR